MKLVLYSQLQVTHTICMNSSFFLLYFSEYTHNFNVDDWADNQNFHYDFYSVMHYGLNAFAINKDQPTIRLRGTYDLEAVQVGQRDGPTENDLAEINQLYGCTESKLHCKLHQITTMLTTSKNVLFPGPNHLLWYVPPVPITRHFEYRSSASEGA